MTKRHLKLTGDLGRVIFMVRTCEAACEEDPVLTEGVRNMTFATLSRLKKASVTPMLSITSSAATILPSRFPILHVR